MKSSKLKRSALILLTVLGLTLAGPLATAVQACPNCKIANEESDAKPRAYMYSILFMLAVPGTMVGGMTFGLFMLGRRESQDLERSILNDPTVPE